MSQTIRLLPLSEITADPEQPRKLFAATELRELADSIKANGLLQPITVRRVGLGQFVIVAGERRFRAHQMIGAEKVRAIVIDGEDMADVRVKQIIENDQRVDVTPMEQAQSYKKLMDDAGWTMEELAQKLGKNVYRVRERIELLNLKPEYQKLLASGNLQPLYASKMSQLGERGQDALFLAIKGGKCRSPADLRVVMKALQDAEAQMSLLGPDDAPEPASEQERREASAFENAVERVAALLRSGIASDNKIVAVKKVDPTRAETLADLLRAMQSDMRRIEVALRAAAAQATFLETAQEDMARAA